MAITNDQSTNPVVQNTTQDPKINLNDVNPVNPTEDNLNFDINLDDATVGNTINEVDINKEPVKTEEKITKTEDTCLDFPDSCFATKPEVKTEDVAIEKAEDVVIEKTEDVVIEKTPETNNSRLQEQDQQNKKEEESLLSGPYKETDINAPMNTTEISGTKSVLEPTINIDQSKTDSFDIGQTNYNSDMKIIEDINGINPVEPKTPLNDMPGISQVKVQETESKNIDLDSLIASNETKTESIESKPIEINTVQIATPEINSLYPSFEQKNEKTDPVVNTININAPVDSDRSGVVNISEGISKMKNNHLLKFLLPAGGVAVLAILIYFVWATMYPMESQNIIPETEVAQVVETGAEQTGLVQELTGEDIAVVDSGVASLANPNVQELHGASPTFDSLGELGEDVSSQSQIEGKSTVIKLSNMASEANTFLTEGQSTNNKLYIKYGTVIAKKCNDLISTLESGQEINNLEGNLAQLEGYLQKLRDIKNAGNQQIPEAAQIPSTESAQTGISSAIAE